MSSPISSKLLKIGHSVQPSAFAVVTHPLWKSIQSAVECIHFTNIARVAQRSWSRNSFQIFRSFFSFSTRCLEKVSYWTTEWFVYCQKSGEAQALNHQCLEIFSKYFKTSPMLLMQWLTDWFTHANTRSKIYVWKWYLRKMRNLGNEPNYIDFR